MALRHHLPLVAAALCCILAVACSAPQSSAAEQRTASHPPSPPLAGDHTSNWAVIVSTSRYWFNYRHASDALSFYHIVRRFDHFWVV